MLKQISKLEDQFCDTAVSEENVAETWRDFYPLDLQSMAPHKKNTKPKMPQL